MLGLYVVRLQHESLVTVLRRVGQLVIGELGFLQQIAGLVVEHGLDGDESFLLDPAYAPGIPAVGLDGGIPGSGFDDPAILAVDGLFLYQSMVPLFRFVTDHVTVGKIGADETVLLVAGDQPAHFLGTRQINPDVVIFLRMLDQHGHRALHVGGLEKARHAHVVDAVGLQLRGAEGLADALLALLVGQCHGGFRH